jgi:predicted enzyme related to lactoylglutathione lyase
MNNFVKFFEIPANDVKRAADFYQKVFNLQMEVHDWGHEAMAMFPGNIGAISKAEGFKPCDNGVLISLDGGHDLNEKLSGVKSAGGKVVVEKTKIQAENQGYFAVFIDTEGNRIGLYSDN